MLQTFFLSYKKLISYFLWHLQVVGLLINRDFVLFVVICFSQLLKFFSSCLLILYHCSWNIFNLLDKESNKSFCCLSNQYFVFFSWYASIKCCISSYFFLLIWSRYYWKSFISMAKESINSFSNIFDYMEGLWLHVLNRTYQKWRGVCENMVETFWVCFSEIDRIS